MPPELDLFSLYCGSCAAFIDDVQLKCLQLD